MVHVAPRKRGAEREGEEPEEASLPLRLSPSLSLGAVDLIHPRVHLAAPPGAVAGGREGERGEIWFPCRSRNDARNLRRETPPIPSPPSLPPSHAMDAGPPSPPRSRANQETETKNFDGCAVRCGGPHIL